MPFPSVIYWSLTLRRWREPRSWTFLYLMRGLPSCTTMFDVLQAGTVLQLYALVMITHASIPLSSSCFVVCFLLSVCRCAAPW
ncbi:uncharacterized protein C8Q71DRAFT_11327 [Rhodofomes roseus]|uniref:Uncharacterized protein n=1 Tax=Rhodofomes roseus TaxID=34475 RepID=A0ABQ8KXD9_9APHY|nr:uncharacterized protein C8Q71DRAFT_11327 [Rhodofomes roseus]KAH9843718.1 hypothetical protein C8Q71DRAFT_11327 [Rhodofomes roseus]